MAEEKVRSQVEDINRSIYDVKDKVEFSYKAETGLTEEIIREISAKKEEPEWMLEKRLKALAIYDQLDFPPWGPDISELDMQHIDTYVRPKTDMKASWEDLPENIRDTFDRLGIPEAEKKSLAGVGAQYDSEVVYHNIQKELEEQGVIYVDFETAVKKYLCRLVRRLLRLCAEGCPCEDAAPELFPSECTGRRTVRAYAHHRRRGGGLPLHRRLLGTPLQCGQSPRRCCRAVREKRRDAALLDH